MENNGIVFSCFLVLQPIFSMTFNVTGGGVAAGGSLRSSARHPIHKAMGGHASDLAFMKRGYGEETVIWDCVVIGDFESLNFRKVKRPWKVPFFRTSCVCVTVCPLENVLTRISCS